LGLGNGVTTASAFTKVKITTEPIKQEPLIYAGSTNFFAIVNQVTYAWGYYNDQEKSVHVPT